MERTRDDTMIPIKLSRQEHLTQESTMCHEHPTQELMFYCGICDQLICEDCSNMKHKHHDVSSLTELRNTVSNEIVSLQQKLLTYDEAIEMEGKVHSDYMEAIEQCRKDITDQKEKINKELDMVCEEEFKELASLQTIETTRYSDKCEKINSHKQTVASALQMLQNGKDSEKADIVIQAKKEADKITHKLDNLTAPRADKPKFYPAEIEHQTIRQQLGGVNTEQENDKAKQTREIDISKVKVKSTLKVKDKQSCVNVIIPTKDSCTWVSAFGDKHLTLINNDGDIIQESVQVDDKLIYDAKSYQDDILVTCCQGNKVIRLAGDGSTTSIFADLQSCGTMGLCVTDDMYILVCVYSTSSVMHAEHMVLRLGKDGEIIQTIRHVYGANSVTSLPTGEIAIVNWIIPREVVCVDRDGQRQFTWTPEVQERQEKENDDDDYTEDDDDDEFSARSITHDHEYIFISDDNNRIYVMRWDGTGAKCLLDKTHGMFLPWAMAVNDQGQLLVGCCYGNIHVIEY